MTEMLIRKSCDLFMEEETFNSLCEENGFHVNYSKATNGFNVTSMFIPLPPLPPPEEGVSKSNVVYLSNYA